LVLHGLKRVLRERVSRVNDRWEAMNLLNSQWSKELNPYQVQNMVYIHLQQEHLNITSNICYYL